MSEVEVGVSPHIEMWGYPDSGRAMLAKVWGEAYRAGVRDRMLAEDNPPHQANRINPYRAALAASPVGAEWQASRKVEVTEEMVERVTQALKPIFFRTDMLDAEVENYAVHAARTALSAALG